jgi:hypothetical protein
MAGISTGNPPGGRAARRRRRQELIAAAAALAAALAVVMAGCSSRGSPTTQASPAPVSTSPTPSPTGTATRPHKITDQELRAWVATLPKGPMPDVPTLSGRQGHFLLVERGHRVPVPADAGQLVYWSRTPYGLVAGLMAEGQVGGYSDQYRPAYIELLRPDGRLVQIAYARMGGFATDPSGRHVAWLQARLKESQPNTVHVVDLATMHEVTRFDEPAWSSLLRWAPAGILIEKGSGFAVRSLDGREVRHRQSLVGGAQGAAGNRLLVREDDCLHVIDLGSAFRTAAFGCATAWTYHDPNGAWGEYVFRPEAVLSPDGTWMMVDGVAVDVATLTRHATLMPAGTHDPNPVMFPLGPKQLLVKVYDSTYHTIAAVVCDLPAGGCQKVPVPFFGPIW